MIRLLSFFVVLGLLVSGLAWLADQTGNVAVTWNNTQYEVSLLVALGGVVALAVGLGVIWSILRFVFRLPSLVSLAQRARRREKGYQALTRGMVAVGAGDARAAQKHAADARKLLADEPLTKLLRAQAAQLSGDRAGAVAAFQEMLEHHHTHALGLRGLHVEARRSGDTTAALEYAAKAHAHAPLPWAAQAVLEDRAHHGDWAGALETVESNAAAKLLDKPTATRWRAVLKTALAQQRLDRDPKGALAIALEAVALAPGLVPAAALAGRLLGENGDYRRASKIIETAYRETPHPDLADAYLRMRRGDSLADRLARAKLLARIVPFDLESQLTVARAALEAQDLEAARKALAPALRGDSGARPTGRACLLMAEIEERDGNDGAVREWLNRAARAPRDRAWVAEGIITDHWAPISPSGQIDAFVWRTPDERLITPAPETIASPPGPSLTIPPPPAAPPSEPSAPASLPEPVAAPAAVAAPPVRSVDAPRASSPVIALPTQAPDDPGPHASSAEAKTTYRLFAGQ